MKLTWSNQTPHSGLSRSNSAPFLPAQKLPRYPAAAYPYPEKTKIEVYILWGSYHIIYITIEWPTKTTTYKTCLFTIYYMYDAI